MNAAGWKAIGWLAVFGGMTGGLEGDRDRAKVGGTVPFGLPRADLPPKASGS